MKRTKIEWLKNPITGEKGYSLNPYVGYKNGCPYCYGRKMNNRFHFVDQWNKPQYKPFWDIPLDTLRKPSKIFLGSMTDLMGRWLTDEEIQSIIDVCVLYSQHTFIWLTKNGSRYADFKFPDNCWLGVTLDCAEKPEIKYCYSPDNSCQDYIIESEYSIDNLTHLKSSGFGGKVFVSFEPLLENPEAYCMSYGFRYLDWVIVGGLSLKPTHKTEWVDMIIKKAREYDIPVFLKNNLKYPVEIKEYPKGSEGKC